MPDAKISDLPAGGDPQDDDMFVVARGADVTNVSLAWSSLSNAATRNNVAVTLDGNTAGALALVSTGTLTLAGGNNITLSQAGNAVTISGANVGGAQTAISGIANSETTYTSGTVSLSELGAITIRSTTGQVFQFSVNPQSVQPETQTFIGGISASDTLYTSGSVRFSGSQAVTVRSGTGQLVIIDAPAQSVQPETQTFIAGISASDTLYTSGNVRFTGVGGGVTVSSNTGQRVDISVAAQSVQPETQTFIGGISASDTLYTSGTVRFTGVGGGITVSTNTGQRVDLSVAAQSVQPETQTFVGGVANSQTTYTSGTVSLSELGAITIRSTTGNQFQFSVNSQTVQTQGILNVALSNVGNTAGDTGINSGTRYVLAGGNGITLSGSSAANATTVTISGITQSVQTQGVLSAGVSTGGNTAGNTTVNTGSRFVIVGSNGITASQGTAAGATTITLSGVTQSVQTNDIPRMGVSTGGNTSGDTTVNSGTRLVFVGTNNITLSQGTAASATTITISGPTVGGNFSAGMSTNGNTSGDTGYASQRLNLVGGNNITLSGSTNGGSMSITISAPNLGAGAFSGGASNLGNTAGSTGITGTQLVFVGTNMVSLSQSTGANGGTLSINATQSVQTQGVPNMGVSTGGATSGDTTVNSGTRFVLVGTHVTLSQGTAANATTVTISAPATSSLSGTGLVSISTNGSTISIGVPGTTASLYDRWGAASKVVGALPGQATLHMQPYPVLYPFQHDRLIYPVHYSQATNSTLTVTISGWFALYTRNVSTLSMLSSTSGTFSINGSGTASSANNSGLRFLTYGWTNTVTPGEYWLAAVSRTTTAGANASISNQLVNLSMSNSVHSGIMGVAAAASQQYMLGLGTYTATTSGIPSNIPFASLTGTGSAAHRAPWVWFISQTA